MTPSRPPRWPDFDLTVAVERQGRVERMTWETFTFGPRIGQYENGQQRHDLRAVICGVGSRERWALHTSLIHTGHAEGHGITVTVELPADTLARLAPLFEPAPAPVAHGSSGVALDATDARSNAVIRAVFAAQSLRIPPAVIETLRARQATLKQKEVA